MKHCTDVFVVGLGEYELPTDPRVAYEGKPPIIGCSNLVCLTCRSLVKHADARTTTRAGIPHKDDLAELYDSKDPASSPLLDGRPVAAHSRTYFCRCNWFAMDLGRFRSVRSIDDNDWECGGHPE